MVMVMNKQPDIKYLRVKHTGKTQGSIFLSDLDDEDNRRQGGKQIPVYIPEGETVDLPLTNNVRHSYQQGTLRGHIESNVLAANIVVETSNEIWVSLSGDDQNPGTKEAPKRTIQEAMRAIYDKVGMHGMKTVYILEDGSKSRTFFKGPIRVNTTNWHFIGVTSNSLAESVHWFSSPKLSKGLFQMLMRSTVQVLPSISTFWAPAPDIARIKARLASLSLRTFCRN